MIDFSFQYLPSVKCTDEDNLKMKVTWESGKLVMKSNFHAHSATSGTKQKNKLLLL